MALITGFRYRDDRTISFKTRVECGWTYERSDDRPRLLQLETYASDGTTSQVLQIDRARARDLLTIVGDVFPELAAESKSSPDERAR
jgi:hypothetical protein